MSDVMSIERPKPHSGMRHVALRVEDMAACEHFYVDLLGMKVEWRPDADNLYLSSGCDNVALHRASGPVGEAVRQRLDHIGFVVDELDQVDAWYLYLTFHKVVVKTAPITHRDGARSFYLLDPAGTTIQVIYHPPISGLTISD